MDIKLSQLPVAAASTPSDLLMVVQAGVNKQITLTSLLNTLDSGNDIQLNPSRNPINIRLSSANNQNLFFLQGTSDSIGIGTNTPQALFHVNGNLKIGLSGNSPLTISSMVWGSGGIISVSTSLVHGFVSGQLLLMSGVTPNAYNGAYTITVTGTNSYTYVLPGYSGSSPGVVSTQGTVSTVSSQGNGLMLHSDETVFFPSGGTSPISLNAARDVSALIVPNGTSLGQFSLGNGIVGQYKTITAASLSTGSGTATVTTGTPSTTTYSKSLGWNTITFSSAGYSVILRCVSISGNPTWICVASYGVTFATLS